MSTVQFFHNQEYSRFTAAVDVDFTRKDLANLLMEQNDMTIDVSFGMTTVHPKDNYDKKIGREVSMEKMERIVFSLDTIYRKEDHLEYVFRGEYQSHPRTIVIRTSGLSDKPHLITVY